MGPPSGSAGAGAVTVHWPLFPPTGSERRPWHFGRSVCPRFEKCCGCGWPGRGSVRWSGCRRWTARRFASLRYLDTFVKVDGAWLFDERNLILDWSADAPLHSIASAQRAALAELRERIRHRLRGRIHHHRLRRPRRAPRSGEPRSSSTTPPAGQRRVVPAQLRERRRSSRATSDCVAMPVIPDRGLDEGRSRTAHVVLEARRPRHRVARHASPCTSNTRSGGGVAFHAGHRARAPCVPGWRRGAGEVGPDELIPCRRRCCRAWPWATPARSMMRPARVRRRTCCPG